MIPKPLITYIETAIIPRYKEFDKAHNLSHVRTVIEESLALARQYPEADERLAYVIAAYHDTGLCRDRATHHLVSGEILMADSTLRQWFSDTEILLMKEAVEDHRPLQTTNLVASTARLLPKRTVSSTRTSPCAAPCSTD